MAPEKNNKKFFILGTIYEWEVGLTG